MNVTATDGYYSRLPTMWQTHVFVCGPRQSIRYPFPDIKSLPNFATDFPASTSETKQTRLSTATLYATLRVP